MKEFVTEKSQLENIDRAKRWAETGMLDVNLFGLSVFLNEKIKSMKRFLINGKPIEEYDIYKTHYPIFMDISKKAINRFDLLSCFGLQDDEISEFKKSEPDKEKLSEIILKRLGLVINENIPDVTSKKIEFFTSLADKVTPEVNSKMNEMMYFSVEETNRVLNGVEDAFYVSDKNKTMNEKLKEWISLHLYADAFEVYLKVLNEIFEKLTKMKKTNSIDYNAKMYKFFDDNYPILLDSTNNKLRNDVCHLNYTERGKYTLEQIDEERTVIIVKALTGIIARNDFLIEFLGESSEKLMGLMDSGSDNLSG